MGFSYLLSTDIDHFQVGGKSCDHVHVTGVPTPPFSSNQALNSYAIFQGVGKIAFLEEIRAGGVFFSW